MRLALWVMSASALLLTGCPSPPGDAPPPPRKPEIPGAPPHALGALAGGTEAAPRPDVALPEGDVVPDVPPAVPEPAAPPGSAPEPAPPAAPDKGMAL